MRQQPALDVEQETAVLARKTAQPAAGREDAMAGNDDRKGIGAASLADRPRRVVQRLGNLAVGTRLVRRNGRDLLPDAALEEGPRGAQGRPKTKSASAR
jgi:hypothetical protein